MRSGSSQTMPCFSITVTAWVLSDSLRSPARLYCRVRRSWRDSVFSRSSARSLSSMRSGTRTVSPGGMVATASVGKSIRSGSKALTLTRSGLS